MRIIKNEKGQGLVEFALILPVLILILMAIIEFGFMFNSYLSLSNGVREAGRSAALGSNNAAVEVKLKDASGSLNPDNLSIIVTPSSRKRGDQITIVATYNYEFITPIIGGIFSSGVTLTSEIKVRME